MNFINIWNLFPKDDEVYIQNSLFMMDSVSELDQVENTMGNLELEDEEGDRISTWITNRKEIYRFLKDRE